MTAAPLTLDAHEKQAHAVHFTRGGRQLVSAGQDGVVRLWSVPGFKPARAFAGHEKGVHSLSFSADETRFASSSSDGSVRLWSFADGKCQHVLERQVQAALGPDGDHLATISRAGRVVLWDGRTGAERRTFEPFDKRHLALAFAATGLFLFVGGTGPITRVSLPDGTVDGVHAGHQIGVACLRPSPNPAILASTGLDGTLRFWTVVGGAEVNCVPIPGQGSLQLAFAPDARSVAVATEGAVLRLKAPDGDLLESHPVPAKGVHGVAFSSDGRYLANAAGDGRVRIWDLHASK
jgi:WD40 repeat protein